MQGKFPVVTLCGSTRFKDEYLRAQKDLTLKGHIVLSVGLFGHAGDPEVWEDMDEGTLTKTKEMLDEMHRAKIDMADYVYVINPGGYIGESTRREIAYAREKGIPVAYLEPVDEARYLDRVHGCLLGGAVGDALGYPVEFMSEERITEAFGDEGIREYALDGDVARISDDTQMTLFTANGLLNAAWRAGSREGSVPESVDYASYVYLAYQDWLKTQRMGRIGRGHTWLVNEPGLFSRRAPGITCLSALESGTMGTIEEPINGSKGCGGIMRVAPVAFLHDPDGMTGEDLDLLAAQCAAITHGDEFGYEPAAALVHLIRLLADENLEIREAVEKTRDALPELFPKSRRVKNLVRLINKSIRLSDSDEDDLTAIHELGEGWVAEETLAISLLCAMRHPDDFEAAVTASVNHNGDSDSTGSVTGQIMGAALGAHAIPGKYLRNLELRSVIKTLADDLAGSPDQIREAEKKYGNHSYKI